MGTDTGKIRLTEDLRAGASYRLPTFRIINTGTEPVGYVMKVVGVAGRQIADASWFAFEPKTFYLHPNEERSVSVTVRLPSGAAPEEYEAILAAVPTVPGKGSGAHIDVGVGPRLIMTVKSAGFFRALYFAVTRWFADHQLWSSVAAALVVAGLAAGVWWIFLRRRPRRSSEPPYETAEPGLARRSRPHGFGGRTQWSPLG